MVSPQIEEGYTKIANGLLEFLCQINLSAYETRTIFALWRKTYGWQKKEDSISVTQFQKLTGLDRRHQARTLKKLEERKIITIAYKGNNRPNNYRFQKDYLKWKDVAHKGNIADLGNAQLPVEATELLPIEAPTKEKKETLQKKERSSVPPSKNPDRFIMDKAIEIYDSYPRRADRKNSLKSIEKILKASPVELLPCPVSGLKLVVQNYQKTIKAKGTEPEYQIQSNNFFGKAERWREFLQPPQTKMSTW